MTGLPFPLALDLAVRVPAFSGHELSKFKSHALEGFVDRGTAGVYDGYGAKGAGVRCEGYGGTVRGVRWYSTRCMVLLYGGYGGTVQGYEGTVQGVMVVRVVPWSGPRAAVAQYTTCIRFGVYITHVHLHRTSHHGTSVPYPRTRRSVPIPVLYPSYPRPYPPNNMTDFAILVLYFLVRCGGAMGAVRLCNGCGIQLGGVMGTVPWCDVCGARGGAPGCEG